MQTFSFDETDISSNFPCISVSSSPTCSRSVTECVGSAQPPCRRALAIVSATQVSSSENPFPGADCPVTLRPPLSPQDCHPKELRCGSRQWSCASADQCVPDSWRCDGQRDCRDGSDEAACKCGAPIRTNGRAGRGRWPCCRTWDLPSPEWRPPAHREARPGDGWVFVGLTMGQAGHRPPAGAPEKCGSSEFQCRSAACLNLSLVCDGKEDCADGSDEGGQCSASACGQAQCSHTCYPSPRGPVSAPVKFPAAPNVD